MSISAQKQSNDNPFGLVYQGAITKNEKGQVNITPVTYKHSGLTIAANVYTPADFDPKMKYPAIVVAHPNGGVKEQVAGLYAQLLAQQGYITIAADAAYQGASSGEPRNTDKPDNRIEDIYAMADFISEYKGVDANRIGALGICGGGGYTLATAQSDKRLKAVATVSMFNTELVRRNGLNNSAVSTISERLKQASEARTLESKGEIRYTAEADLRSITDEMLAQIPKGLYRDGTEYYGKTHYHPNSTPRYTTSSLLDLITFDATDHIDLIHQPFLMIIGDQADTHYMIQAVFDNATGTSDKELFIVKGATHIETYWKPEYVKQIAEKLTDFFGKNLHR